jgi:hypothetical protein
MIAVRIIVWIGRIAGLGALLLGLLFWIANIDFISVHILFGLAVALALLALSIMMIFNRGTRVLGVTGIVYALILPVFGLRQAILLVGNIHWLIQVIHLLVGIGALALIQVMSTRYERFRLTTTKAAVL